MEKEPPAPTRCNDAPNGAPAELPPRVLAMLRDKRTANALDFCLPDDPADELYVYWSVRRDFGEHGPVRATPQAVSDSAGRPDAVLALMEHALMAGYYEECFGEERLLELVSALRVLSAITKAQAAVVGDGA